MRFHVVGKSEVASQLEEAKKRVEAMGEGICFLRSAKARFKLTLWFVF